MQSTEFTEPYVFLCALGPNSLSPTLGISLLRLCFAHQLSVGTLSIDFHPRSQIFGEHGHSFSFATDCSAITRRSFVRSVASRRLRLLPWDCLLPFLSLHHDGNASTWCVRWPEPGAQSVYIERLRVQVIFVLPKQQKRCTSNASLVSWEE